jgi:LysM repeat protein
MAELTFDQLSPEEKEAVVSFYNSQGQDIGTPITEATLPPARQTLSPPPVDVTSLDTGEPVSAPNSSWRDMVVATEVSPTRGIMTDGPDMDEVQAFQERNGLPRDGVLDENTFRAMSAQALGQTQAPDGPPVAQEDPTQPAPTEAPVTYTIQGGDTLSKIASENTFTLDQLKAANPDITNFNNVMVGQEINLPVEGAPVVETPAVQTPVVDTPVVETPAVEPVNFWTEEKTLGLNSSNRNAVREVQSILGTAVDGGFGPNTAKALEDFQRDNGLEVTGAVDNAETYNALRELAVTDDTNPAFYGTPAPVSPVSLVTETPWSTDRVPTQSRWNVNGERINVTGVDRTFNVGEDTLNIIDITESTMPTQAGQRLPTHTPTRIVFHNTAGMRDNVVGFMDYNNFASAQFYISRDGTVYQVTDPEHEGNHAMGLQTGSVGIEIEGYPERHPETTPDNLVTPEQDAAAALLGEYLINRYPTINQAVSHREIGLQRKNGNYVNSGKTDGWTALRAFRERIGQTGYDMGTGSNTNTHMGTRVKDIGYFQGDQANG